MGGGDGLVKTATNQNTNGEEIEMADDSVHPTATEMDYPAHERNYSGFLKLLKYGIIVTAIVTAVVIYTISN